ncbi:UNVERIFIED_ORG: hypothetical protein CLV66_11814 [Actinomadura viridilutea]
MAIHRAVSCGGGPEHRLQGAWADAVNTDRPTPHNHRLEHLAAPPAVIQVRLGTDDRLV